MANPLKVFSSCDIVLSAHGLKFLLLIDNIEDPSGFTFLVCNGDRLLFDSFSHKTSTIVPGASSQYPYFSQVRSPLRSLAFVIQTLSYIAIPTHSKIFIMIPTPL